MEDERGKKAAFLFFVRWEADETSMGGRWDLDGTYVEAGFRGFSVKTGIK